MLTKQEFNRAKITDGCWKVCHYKADEVSTYDEDIENMHCPHCGSLTALGEWVEMVGLDYAICHEGMFHDSSRQEYGYDTDGIFKNLYCKDFAPPTQQEIKRNRDALEEMEKKKCLSIVGVYNFTRISKRKGGDGDPYFIVTEVTRTVMELVCERCFAMEPALAEADEECRRYTKIRLKDRCRCGRVEWKGKRGENMPNYVECVYCMRDRRMLEAQLFAVKRNRHLIKQIEAKLKERNNHAKVTYGKTA